MRPIAQWVEEEIIIPNGPFAGEPYRHHRHPISKLWFDAIDSGNWSRFAATGPTQNGKTLMCYVLPVMYHLFEIGETVVIGLPSLEIANDKWQADFRPVIEASRYRDLLPIKGEGSKGGQVKRSIEFRNGATLRFMTAGGDDKKRSAFTTRVVAITETDGMDVAGESSREADKIEQIEARTRAFGRTGKRIYLECTVSTPEGRIWREYEGGTASKIVRKCPHCGEYVLPEREQLVGWENAKSEEEAASLAVIVCPSCAEPWDEDQRIAAAKTAVLVHQGQQIDKQGVITGDAPETQTLGFRWNPIDNPFVTAADLGAEEWKSKREKDRENAEKKMTQFVWVRPYESPDVELTPLDPETLAKRGSGMKRGIVPVGCLGIAIGIDTGKRELNWDAKAIGADGESLCVIEYGEQVVESDRLGIRKALIEALLKLKAYFDRGWAVEGGGTMGPRQVWIDSGWHEHTDAIYAFCAVANKDLPTGAELYRPSKGYGEGQKIGRYVSPKQRSRDILFVGDEFHISTVKRNGKKLPGVRLVHMNSDHWKSKLHQGLMLPDKQPGAICLYDVGDPNEHAEYISQLMAEKQVEKFCPLRGRVITWERMHRNNHKLDAGYASTCAAHFILSLLATPVVTKPAARPTAADLLAAAENKRRR